jgi:pimeloyl-ACP methyl ester carboxylesterase
MPECRYLYLHGFASSPRSRKARYFLDHFAELGLPLEILQLDCGDFEHLTLSGELQLLAEAAQNEPCVLVGSSLGGYLAALYAARNGNVQSLVLLAPAFRFPTHFPASLGDARLAAWKATGKLSVFHYADGAERALHYEFYRDGIQYEPEPDFRQPALIVHGTHDEVVPAEFSIAYAEGRENIDLHLVDGGHELTAQLADIWSLVAPFLHLNRIAN